MGTTAYGANAIAATLIEHLPDYHLALTYDAPDQNTSGSNLNEPSDPAYVRQPVSMSVADWTTPINGAAFYSQDIAFPTTTEQWGAIAYWCLCTAQIGGNVVMWGTFSPSASVPSGQILTVSADTIGLFVGVG